MTAAVIITAFAVVCLSIATVCVTVIFRQALRDMSHAYNVQSARHDDQLSRLLDRFQAMRWEDLAAMRTIEDPEDGGFLTPEEQREEAGVEVDEQVRWGPLSRLRAANDMSEAERALLEEDFPEDFAEGKP
jgi:hypothetical protein